MRIITKEQQQTTKWSGGLTTDLYIYPQDAVYAERNFSYRLSTATVEIETSLFTSLPGVKRTLMVLEGKMELIHTDHHSTTLSPLMSDNFMGDWSTNSKGTCTDLNLMCRGEAEGQLSGHRLNANESLEIELNGKHNYLYLYSGSLVVNDMHVEAGLLIVCEEEQSLSLIAQADSTCVVIEISNTGV